MKFDPGNRYFIATFAVIVLGVIAFLISSIFIDFSDESKDGDELKKIGFERSKFSMRIAQLDADKSYVIQVYNDGKWIQNVKLGTNFGAREVEVVEIKDGWKIRSSDDDEISFTVDIDTDKFATLYVKRKFSKKDSTVTDCIDLDPKNLNWYGGPQQMDQRYPIQKFEFTNYAYITKELESAAIMERYWLASNGFFIVIDYEAPLFIDQNNANYPDHICFTGKKALPFDIHQDGFAFNYRIGVAENAKETHMNVINRILGKPTGIPDERLVRYPIWNSWVRYGRPISQQIIADYAQEIIEHGFKYSLFDIDDFWEDCYGATTLSSTTFPNLKALTTDLKSKGFIMGMWTHPFINKACEPHYTIAKENNYLVKSYSGRYDTSWWNSGRNEAAHVDFTNPAARSWFKKKLQAIQETHGIDVFKFDAGETSWFPEDPILTGDPHLSPSLMTRSWVEMASEFGKQLEVRTGWGTQNLEIFVRMLDFDSRWEKQNGLKSLIPTLIQFNMNGYVFVLPDMIGGNQYGTDVITKELFIRWLQATVFMPSLQFSWTPWQFDRQTIDISKNFTKLHEDNSDYIIERFNLAVSSGDPVNPPIWWLDPEDKEAQMVDDEFLLGDKFLAAPVIEQGKLARDIYLPVGTWKDGNDGKMYEGKQWIRNYPAPIDVLPYFIRQN